MAGNPRRHALLGAIAEIFALRRLGGGRTRARTWDPMIKSLPLVTYIKGLAVNFASRSTLLPLLVQCLL
jgi:hypothetical protein